MPSGQGLAICVIAMNCIFLCMAKAMELTPDQKESPDMLDKDTITENSLFESIIAGCVSGDTFFSTVFDDELDEFLFIDECMFAPNSLATIKKGWCDYLTEWFNENESLIKKAVEIYARDEHDAWGFGVDVAHCVLRTGVSFESRAFIDDELAESLDDSLHDYKTDDGVNEYWLENGCVHAG